jgi:hypothetical protein
MNREQEWMGRFEADAIRQGDEQRLSLARAVYLSDALRESSPADALQIIEQARQLARRLREPWWELFYDDRRAGVLMKYLGHASQGLEQAVRNAVRLTDPTFAHFPWRFRVLDHLVVGYLHTDPVGYAEEISAALDHLEQECPEFGPARYLVLARRRWLASERGFVEEAARLARIGLNRAASDPDSISSQSHAVYCFSHLCHSAWKQRDPHLGELAREGEQRAQVTGHQLELSEFQVWQALVARQAGLESQAQRLSQQARSRIARMGMIPDHIYYDALCAFHLVAHEREAALVVRDAELATLLGWSRLAAETRCRLERCRLLAQLGRLQRDDLDATRAVIHQLRRPQRALAQLADLESQV